MLVHEQRKRMKFLGLLVCKTHFSPFFAVQLSGTRSLTAEPTQLIDFSGEVAIYIKWSSRLESAARQQCEKYKWEGGMVARHFRIARKISGINCRYSLFSAKISFLLFFFFFLISYLLFLLVLTEIKCEAKLVRRGRVNTSDAARDMDNFRNKSLCLDNFSPLFYQLVLLECHH